MTRKPYPSDVSDDEWAFVAPYLTLMTEDAPQRDHPLRKVFNGLRYIARSGAQWRMLPNHDVGKGMTELVEQLSEVGARLTFFEVEYMRTMGQTAPALCSCAGPKTIDDR